MPITEKQLQRRANHIGSSDMAAILGVSRWKTAYDVWLEKTGKVELNSNGNEAMRAGNMFEDGVLRFAESELGKLIRNQYRSRPDLHLGANIDAIVVATNEPVDAKTSGLFGPLPSDWGEPGTDQVPLDVIVQAHVHLLCLNGSEPQQCHIAAFLGGRGFHLYRIARQPKLCDIVAERAVLFWEKNVLADVPPEGAPSIEIAKAIQREPGKVLEAGALDPDLIERWESTRKTRLAAEKAEEEAQAALLAALGDAEIARLPDGRELTYLPTTTRRVDTKRLKEEAPDVAEQFTVESSYRSLRIRKGKP